VWLEENSTDVHRDVAVKAGGPGRRRGMAEGQKQWKGLGKSEEKHGKT